MQIGKVALLTLLLNNCFGNLPAWVDERLHAAIAEQLATRVCACGGRYLHLALELPAYARGRELGTDELEQYGARLQEFSVREILPLVQ
ncbi:MAG: CRISPR-associated protein Csx16 [Thauera sp.]|jgi:hypothetical protein|nr:CRISPR-associated protein Csx16 [Thauera sp.]